MKTIQLDKETVYNYNNVEGKLEVIGQITGDYILLGYGTIGDKDIGRYYMESAIVQCIETKEIFIIKEGYFISGGDEKF